jgi:hypothetical protein
MESRLQAQLREALASQPARDFVNELSGRVLDGAESATTATLRAVRTSIVLAIICELLRYADVSEATFLGLKIVNLALLLKVTPALISFHQYRIVAEMIRRKILMETGVALVHARLPGAHEQIVGLILEPAGLMSEYILGNVTSPRYERLLTAFTQLVVLLIIASPAGFAIYEIVRAFAAFGFADSTLWLSTTLSAFFLAQSATYLLGFNHFIGDPKPQQA